jgi:hypothetical protein
MNLEDEADAWEIDDAELRHRNAPDMYPIPPLAERTDVRVGERVELYFVFRGRDQHGLYIQSERLRVTVRDASPSGYVGTLDNPPTSSSVLRKGATVSFEPRHIAAICWEPGK